MSPRDLGVGVLCGLLLGAYVGWAFGPNRSVPPAPSFTAAARAAAGGDVRLACPPAPAVVPPGASADDDALIEAQDHQIRALAEAAFGRPLVWPDPAMPAEAEATLEEALATCAPEVRFVETDCSEPPCLAAFDFDEGGATVSDLCPDIPPYGYTASYVWCPDGSRHRVHVVKLAHAEDYREGNRDRGGRNIFKRFQVRADDLWSAFVCP